MNNHMDKSLFFLTISFVCVWLVVDVAIGKNRLGAFLSAIFPFMGGADTRATTTQVEEVNTTTDKDNKYSVPGTTSPLDSILNGGNASFGSKRTGVL